MDAFSSLGFTEANRSLQIDTPEGKDAFLTEKFWCSQVVNGLDEGKVTLRAKRDDVKPQDIVGKEVTVSLMTDHSGARRKWNYLVTGLSEQPRLTRGLRQYEMTLRPTLWLMSQKSDCRIFLNKTAVQIAEILCDEHGIKGLDASRVFDLPPAQEYTVQWKETDLDFLIRMFQKYGIFYWTRQDDGKQVLVLTNKPVGWDKGADGDKGRARIAFGSTADNHISEWRTDYQFVPGKHTGRDWNFEDPNRVQRSEVTSTVKLPRNGSYEFYQYPALAMNGKDAEKQMTSHAQASEAAHQTIVGTSDIRDLAPGAKVTPFDLSNPTHSYDTAVIISIEHTAVNQSYETTEGDTEPEYSNSFTALPASLPATPQRTIPRPRIDGTLPAIIAGPEGEEIHCSKYGDVKVWWQWDRRAKKDGTDTKWIRVTQPWAGGGWGMQVIPRIGMEATVIFEDGDPDRPLIIGLLPNPNMKVPYELPANKTRMVVKSKTYKGIGSNELRFEDATNMEEVFLHSQRDRNEITERDYTHLTKRDRVEKIQGDTSLIVDNDWSKFVSKNDFQHVGGSYSLIVGPAPQYAYTHANMGWYSDMAGGPLKRIGLGKDRGFGDYTYTVNVRGDVKFSSAKSITHTARNSIDHKANTRLALSAGDRLDAVAKELKIHGNETVIVSAASSVTLMCGNSMATLNSNGDLILQGVNIKLEGVNIKLKTKGI